LAATALPHEYLGYNMFNFAKKFLAAETSFTSVLGVHGCHVKLL